MAFRQCFLFDTPEVTRIVLPQESTIVMAFRQCFLFDTPLK